MTNDNSPHAMTGTIEINDMRLCARHGALEQERLVGNVFSVTVHLRCDMKRAIESDALEDTINYAAVAQTIKRVMATPSALLEHVAGRIVAELTRQFPQVEGGMVRVAKLTPPMEADVADVAVKIQW